MGAALLVVLAVAAASLHVLFRDGAWWFVVVFVLLIVLSAATAVRALTVSRVLPTVAAVVALGGAITLLFLPQTSILGVIPTFDTFDAVGEMFSAANASIYRQSLPADAESSIVFVLAVGFGLLAVLGDLLALTARRPALAGLPVLVILAVPVVTRREIADPFSFAVTAAVFLAFLLLASSRPQPRLAAGIGALAIIGSLLGPALLPRVPEPLQDGPALDAGVNPVLDLGDDLRRASDRAVLDYSTASGNDHYLRLVTLENFTAEQWGPTTVELDRANSVDDFDPAPGLADDVAVEPETTSVDINGLSSRWLPMTYPPTSVSGLPSEWYFEPKGFSVSRPGATVRGLEYTIESLNVQPTPAQLLAAGTVVDPSLARYLALPDGLPGAIGETSTAVVGAAASHYEQALALQEFFRSAEFEYSETAPVDGDYDGTGMDIIATFLDVRSGYCVHFASSMAVMARTLGIPSRVVVGFLPGDDISADDGDFYRVSTHDLHAWPELYFDGIGWVQFEPTPGRGELGAYADVTAEGVPAPVTAPSLAPIPSASAAPSASPSARPRDDALDSPAVDGAASRSTVPLVVAGVLAGLLGASMIPALVRAVLRRRLMARLDSGRANAVDAWREVVRSARDLGMPVSGTDTPRRASTTLAAGGASLAGLIDAVEIESYGDGRTKTETDPRGLARSLSATRVGLSTAVSRRDRIVAALYPPSIWRRIAHPFTPPD